MKMSDKKSALEPTKSLKNIDMIHSRTSQVLNDWIPAGKEVTLGAMALAWSPLLDSSTHPDLEAPIGSGR